MKVDHNGCHSTDEGQVERDSVVPSAGNDSITDESAAAREPDVVFRVSLPDVKQPVGGLEDFYRGTLEDLLQVVRFSFRGKPVLVDAFAFLNQPDREIRILREDDHGVE